MKKMNKHVENTYNQISNSLEFMYAQGFVRDYKQPHYITCNDSHEKLTWSNHSSGRQNCGDSFTTISQYISIYETGAYHAILSDGSIIRATFEFDKNILVSQNLLYWPAPINIPIDDISELGIRDALQMYLSDIKCDSKMLRMRTPVRFDYDSKSESHSCTHVHLQHSNCRISATKPICFNTFIKFIINNFYPDILINLRDLEKLDYTFYPIIVVEYPLLNV